ncbi:MAG TPA: hypothetical protein VG890_12910 [Puia sp.]|nr:hypothetical protein [Puia sp.]
MNQTFDFNRWRLLIAKHGYEQGKKYLLSLVAIAALLLIWFVFVLFANPYEPLPDGAQFGTYYVGLFLVGCIYASLLFSDLASRPRGIDYLSLPASHLEKLLCALFYGVLIFFLAYTIVFYIVELPMIRVARAIAYAHWLKTAHPKEIFNAGETINVFVMPRRPAGAPNAFFYILLSYFAVQAAFILGSVYFPKFSFIKTVVTLLLIGLVYVFLVDTVVGWIMPEGRYYHAFTAYNFHGPNGYEDGKVVTLPEWFHDLLSIIVRYAFAPIFWITTYFRLKEKEI